MGETVYKTAYGMLLNIYRDGAFIGQVMKENTNKRVAKMVFGVLDKHFELNYIINSLAPRQIKSAVRPVLLLAAYHVLHLNAPKNVVINEMNGLLEDLGKGAIKDFADAVIFKIAAKEYILPSKSDKNYTEVKYNMPSFLVGMYKKDYTENFEEIIFAPAYEMTHVCLNKEADESEILEACPDAIKTDTGFFVKMNREISLLNTLGRITIMSYTSTLVAESIGEVSEKSVLDVCAAPGGKSVYLAQKGAKVISCDIHPHRTELIRAYAKRMNVSLTTLVKDATEYKSEWEKSFDVVLADVPCSGLGVVGKRRDIILNRTFEDITELAALQRRILNNCKNYVKSGGILLYSTCTIFSKENGENVRAFLSENSDFSIESERQFLPDGKGIEGFYICKMKRK